MNQKSGPQGQQPTEGETLKIKERKKESDI